MKSLKFISLIIYFFCIAFPTKGQESNQPKEYDVVTLVSGQRLKGKIVETKPDGTIIFVSFLDNTSLTIAPESIRKSQKEYGAEYSAILSPAFIYSGSDFASWGIGVKLAVLFDGGNAEWTVGFNGFLPNSKEGQISNIFSVFNEVIERVNSYNFEFGFGYNFRTSNWTVRPGIQFGLMLTEINIDNKNASARKTDTGNNLYYTPSLALDYAFAKNLSAMIQIGYQINFKKSVADGNVPVLLNNPNAPIILLGLRYTLK